MSASHSQQFVHHLTARAAGDPAIRAALRSGLGRTPDQCPQMHQHLARWLARDPAAHTEQVYYLIAALLARTPAGAVPEQSPGDLGDSLATAARHRDLAPRTCSRYLHLLTRQPPDSVCRHVTTAVMALREKRVPVDFVRLLNDLLQWPRQQNEIAKRWQRHYYQNAPDEI